MSEQIPGGKSDQASGENQNDQVAYESYAKLLSEKKKLQSEHLEAKAKLEEYEQAKLEAEGKLKEANENLKKMLAQAKEEKVSLFKNVATKSVRQQFFREAEKLGCNDPELAMKAVSLDDLEITEDFEFDGSKLQSKIQELTKTKPFLFKKDFKLPPDVTPNAGKMPTKNLSEMSEAEIKEIWKTIK